MCEAQSAQYSPAIQRGNPLLNLAKDHYYLSELLERKVLSSENGPILGVSSDLVVSLEETNPHVIALVIRRKWRKRKLSAAWEDVARISQKEIVLKRDAEVIPFTEASLSPSRVLLRNLLLDKQIVDVDGAKVERVNDLHFVRLNGSLVLDFVDVGLRGMLRRLGFEDAAVRFAKWFFDYDLKDRFIPWHFVQPLADFDRLRLQIPQSKLQALHPADLADIIEDMDVRERAAIVDSLNQEVLAEALEEMDPKVQVAIMRGLEPEKAADIIEEMSPDEAADLIADLPQDTANGIFRELAPEYSSKVKELLEHEEDEAGGLMTTQFMALSPDQTIVDAFNYIRQHANEMDVIYYVYVVNDQSQLLGVVSIRDLLSHEIFTPLGQIMTTRVITAHVDDSANELANLFAKYGFRGIPVVDEKNRIQGVVRFKALLDILAPHLGK